MFNTPSDIYGYLVMPISFTICLANVHRNMIDKLMDLITFLDQCKSASDMCSREFFGEPTFAKAEKSTSLLFPSFVSLCLQSEWIQNR